MNRFLFLLWVCAGAIGLGILTLAANKRQVYLSRVWYFTAILLGPIFLCFVLPLWLGKWGDNKKN